MIRHQIAKKALLLLLAVLLHGTVASAVYTPTSEDIAYLAEIDSFTGCPAAIFGAWSNNGVSSSYWYYFTCKQMFGTGINYRMASVVPNIATTA